MLPTEIIEEEEGIITASKAHDLLKSVEWQPTPQPNPPIIPYQNLPTSIELDALRRLPIHERLAHYKGMATHISDSNTVTQRGKGSKP
jgi:hypothetical protein